MWGNKLKSYVVQPAQIVIRVHVTESLSKKQILSCFNIITLVVPENISGTTRVIMLGSVCSWDISCDVKKIFRTLIKSQRITRI